MEKAPGSYRLGTTTQGFSPKYYGNSWAGNQYAETFNIGKIGKGLSYFGAGLGTAVDIYGVINYYNHGPNSPNTVSPGRFGFNLGLTAYGLTGIGAPISAVYFGIEAFYPGGWLGNRRFPGAIEDNRRLIEANQQITKNFQLYKNFP